MNVRYWPKAVVQRVLLNVCLRWKADIQNVQLECLLNTESGHSDAGYLHTLQL